MAKEKERTTPTATIKLIHMYTICCLIITATLSIKTDNSAIASESSDH